MSFLNEQQARYADLLIRVGVNLQPGQSLNLTAELEHAPLARALTAAAYDAGARYVQVNWYDTPTARARLRHSRLDDLDYFPSYEVTRHRQMVDEAWPRLTLVGPAHPDIFDDVDPQAMRRSAVARRRAIDFYAQAMMANHMQWCVAGAPSAAWAAKVFPDLPTAAALDRLWELVLRTCRLHASDPAAAWREHDRRLQAVAAFMAQRQVRTLRYLDPTPGPDGRPRTQLTIGLTDRPQWVGASSQTPAGVTFLPNMPTEEVFSTPHNERTEGWVRTAKPAFPFERQVEDAWFRFEAGEVVEYQAAVGQEVLDEFFQVRGTRRLGEVSLVDVRSPINETGILFYETLFDENAVSHIAFGEAYPDGVVGGSAMSAEELTALGVNRSDSHVDFMIGTETMDVTALCADGSEAPILRRGRFTDAVLSAAIDG